MFAAEVVGTRTYRIAMLIYRGAIRSSRKGALMWEDLTFAVTVLGFIATITLLLVELRRIAGGTAHPPR